MNEEIQIYMENYSKEIQALFAEIKELITKSVSGEIEEKLWAKIPSFYVKERFVRLIPFKDHINVEALAMVNHTSELKEYKMTPKGMLQIYLNQDIPYAVLQLVFQETLI